MALLVCPECDGKVSEYASACPHCGCPVSIIKHLITQQSKEFTHDDSKDKRRDELLTGAIVKHYDRGIERKISKIENATVYFLGGGQKDAGTFLMSYQFIDPANRDLFESLFSKEISTANLKFESQKVNCNKQTRRVASFPSEDDYYHEVETGVEPVSLSDYYYNYYHGYDG